MSTQPPDDDRTVISPRTERVAPPSSATAIAGAGAGASNNDAGEHLPSGTMLGEFELTSLLGEGGFGIVYLAWDHSLQRRVALKEYMPSSLAKRAGTTQVQVKSERHRETFEAGLKSFINEARLLAQFDHPSLVKVYRFWEANGTAYMVMPFYEGITLKDKLKEMSGPPDEPWLLGLLAPLTEALAVIHAEKCYHRDIAPDNVILLAGSGKPLLLDFGAARRVIGDMTQALTVILKPGYAPVEQYAEAPGMKQGPWTDVYALAASVYFAILGKTPPPSVSRLMSDHYVPLSESCAGRYSDRFLQSIDKALRVRPEERTPSIAALRAELGLGSLALASQETQMLADSPAASLAPRPAAERLPAQPTPAPLAARQTSPPAGSRAPLWIGLGAGVLVIGGLAVYLSREPAKPAVNTPAIAAATPVSPAAPTATPPAVVAPANFDVRSEFDRVLRGQTPGFDVEAIPGRPQLRIDKDNLSFGLNSSRDGFVTVLVLGPDGSLTRLIPSAEMPAVKIKAGTTLKLPPRGVNIGTTEPAGPEHFMVIVSSQPRDYSALSSRSEGGYLLLPTGAEAAAKLGQLSTRLPALLGAAKDCSAANCDDYGSVQFTIDVLR